MFDFLNDIEAQHLFLAIAGQVIHILARLLKLYKSRKKFVWKTFVIENTLESILAGLCITVLLIVLKSEMNNILALTVGYSTDSIFKQATARAGVTDQSPFERINDEN